jgi:hypothetical protein
LPLVLATDQTAREGEIWGRNDSCVGKTAVTMPSWGGVVWSALIDGLVPGSLLEVAIDVCAEDRDVSFGFRAHLLYQHLSLVAMVEVLDCLLEADGDEQANTDGGDVDEEVAPGVGGGVGRVDVEHGRVLCGVRGDATQMK